MDKVLIWNKPPTRWAIGAWRSCGNERCRWEQSSKYLPHQGKERKSKSSSPSHPYTNRSDLMVQRRIRILVVDDHPILRKGLAAIIDPEPDMEVVGSASSGMQAVELFREKKDLLCLQW